MDSSTPAPCPLVLACSHFTKIMVWALAQKAPWREASGTHECAWRFQSSSSLDETWTPKKGGHPTVDGWNPAPPGMYETL